MWSSTSIASTNTAATLPTERHTPPPFVRSALTVSAERTNAHRRPLHAGDFALFEGLDEVAGLEVLEVGEADTALEALADLAGIFLEPAQRGDRALPDDDAVAQEAHLRATGDDPRAHVAAGDRADPGHPEDLADLGLAGDDLLEL